LSQIGRPIDDPLVANVKILPETKELPQHIVSEIEVIVDEELKNITKITDMVLKEEVILY